jgi:transcriptional regulator with XRE-family HTH domain
VEDIVVGEKVREWRNKRNMTVRALSEASGITPSMLSQIENNQSNPSIATLRTIADVLQVPLWKFFLPQGQTDPVVHPDERRILGLADSKDVRYELLTADTSGDIECCEMVIPGGCASAPQPKSHFGEEVAYVLKGNVVIEVEDRKYELHKGDSIRIQQQEKHRWVNEEKEEARVLFAVTPPGF